MLVYCKKHMGMYDNKVGCTYCPQSTKGTGLGTVTLGRVTTALRSNGLDYHNHNIYINEWTWRQLLNDSEASPWLDIVVDITDTTDIWGNPLPGRPVPPITEPIAHILGGSFFIDPKLDDYRISSRGTVVTI
jgi:hypothetical protein